MCVQRTLLYTSSKKGGGSSDDLLAAVLTQVDASGLSANDQMSPPSTAQHPVNIAVCQSLILSGLTKCNLISKHECLTARFSHHFLK